MPNDLKKGWTGSIVVHLLLLLILLLVEVPPLLPRADFVEVTWGGEVQIPAVAREPQPASAPPSTTAPASRMSPKTSLKQQAARPVDLPERTLPGLDEDVLTLPQASKQDVDRTSRERQPVTGPTSLERDRTDAGRTPGSDREGTRTGLPSSGNRVGANVGPAASGTNVGKGVGFSVQWTDGGTRQRISGNLPKYPDGVNLEAEVRILTAVAPDGSVTTVSPAQKADTRLENAAMREVRFWKFEPLKPAVSQVVQTCTITFHFRLK